MKVRRWMITGGVCSVCLVLAGLALLANAAAYCGLACLVAGVCGDRAVKQFVDGQKE